MASEGSKAAEQQNAENWDVRSRVDDLIKPETKWWRSAFELSSMSNNEELIVHSQMVLDFEFGEKLLEQPAFKAAMLRNWGDNTVPRIVFSRPVFAVEIKAGLNTQFQGLAFDESDVPAVTLVYDDVFKLLGHIKIRTDLFRMSVDAAFASVVGNDVYDCMSAGVSGYYISAARFVIKTSNIDLNAQLYPRYPRDGEPDGEYWHTVADFLEETSSAPDLETYIDVAPLLLLGQ